MKKSSRRETIAVQSNCKIFAFQGHYLSTFDKKQYRNTLKMNPPKFFHLINKLALVTIFLKFRYHKLLRKGPSTVKPRKFLSLKVFQLRSTNYQTRKKSVSRYASINFVCNYYFLIQPKRKSLLITLKISYSSFCT